VTDDRTVRQELERTQAALARTAAEAEEAAKSGAALKAEVERLRREVELSRAMLPAPSSGGSFVVRPPTFAERAADELGKAVGLAGGLVLGISLSGLVGSMLLNALVLLLVVTPAAVALWRHRRRPLQYEFDLRGFSITRLRSSPESVTAHARQLVQRVDAAEITAVTTSATAWSRTRGTVRVTLASGATVSIDDVPGFRMLAEWLRNLSRVEAPAPSAQELQHPGQQRVR